MQLVQGFNYSHKFRICFYNLLNIHRLQMLGWFHVHLELIGSTNSGLSTSGHLQLVSNLINRLSLDYRESTVPSSIEISTPLTVGLFWVFHHSNSLGIPPITITVSKFSELIICPSYLILITLIIRIDLIGCGTFK